MAWITEADGRCIYLSPAWYRFTGRCLKEGLGYEYLKVMPPADRDAARIAYLQALDSDGSFEVNFSLENSEGSFVPVEARGTLLRDVSGKVHTLIGLVHSVNGHVQPPASRTSVPVDKISDLTPRQREILQLITSGHRNRAIAESLGISIRTVELHRATLMSRLGARNLVDLVSIVSDQIGATSV